MSTKRVDTPHYLPSKVHHSLRQNEQGLAAIVVTMIMIVVISLIVIGFAQISRREQRQALDQHLSTAAYYAAESGVNDVINLLASNPNAGEKKTCGKDPANTNWDALYTPNANKGNVLDDPSDVQYTCVLVNPQPGQLEKDLSIGSAWVVPLRTANSTNFSTITFTWTRLGGVGSHTTCPSPNATNYTFPAVGGAWNCPYGLLRFDLVPVASNMTANSLLQNTMTAFVIPSRSATQATPFNYVRNFDNNAPAGAGVSSGAANTYKFGCNATQCTATINVASAATSSLYLRLTSIYQDGHLRINATDASGNTSFVGAQVQIDSTGKASDQVKRIRVAVPHSNAQYIPDYVVQTTSSLCKQFSIIPGAAPQIANADSACQLP